MPQNAGLIRQLSATSELSDIMTYAPFFLVASFLNAIILLVEVLSFLCECNVLDGMCDDIFGAKGSRFVCLHRYKGSFFLTRKSQSVMIWFKV